MVLVMVMVMVLVMVLVMVIKKVPQAVDWYVAPLLNPDGYEYSHTNDRMWRKNRQLKNDDKYKNTLCFMEITKKVIKDNVFNILTFYRFELTSNSSKFLSGHLHRLARVAMELI